FAACASDGEDGMDGKDGMDGANGKDGAAGSAGGSGEAGPQDALPGLYTLSNATASNQVSAWLRSDNGNLSRNGAYATTGKGTGAGIGSQGALVFDDATQRFFAVNPGDNSISMLQLGADGRITMLAKVASGGVKPISVAVHGDLVYVTNYGDITAAQVNANVTGFKVTGTSLTAIPGSTRPLSITGDAHPTDVGFSPDGSYVLVIERATSKLDTFKLVDGVAQAGSFQASSGLMPFAFDWSPEGFLLVAEVGDGSATGSSASSYALSAAGALTPITAKLPTKQAAACWIVSVGGYAYLANAGSGNITGLNVSETGALTLHDQSGVTATTGLGAIDIAVSPDRGLLYSLSTSDHAIHPYAIGIDGGLTAMPVLANLPTAAVGLVAR
ncbi:MAG TPA: beta-propeller fold lactonase family protein, partial [Kofleriaceae bacterium]